MVKTALDDLTDPPAAQLLGWRLLDSLPREGWIKVGFRQARVLPRGRLRAGWLSLSHARFLDGSGPHRDERGQALFEYGQHYCKLRQPQDGTNEGRFARTVRAQDAVMLVAVSCRKRSIFETQSFYLRHLPEFIIWGPVRAEHRTARQCRKGST